MPELLRMRPARPLLRGSTRPTIAGIRLHALVVRLERLLAELVGLRDVLRDARTRPKSRRVRPACLMIDELACLPIGIDCLRLGSGNRTEPRVMDLAEDMTREARALLTSLLEDAKPATAVVAAEAIDGEGPEPAHRLVRGAPDA